MEIRTGRIVDANMVFLLMEDPVLAEDDVPHSGVAIRRRDNDWRLSRLDYNGISAAVVPEATGVNRQVVVIGNTGKCTVLSEGTGTDGVIKDETALASVSLVHGSVIAVGIVGGVYRMTRPDSWEELTDETVEENLSAVCGHPAGGFLVSGWQGLVSHYRDDGVTRLETGTNVILTDIMCDDGGEIIACGQRGTVLRGTTNSLRPLILEGISEDFWSVAKFQGEIYLTSTTALYRLVDDVTVELVKPEGEEVPTSFYHLDTFEDSLLLSVGQKDAVLFDGSEWTRAL